MLHLLFCIAVSIQLLYWGVGFMRLAIFKQKKQPQSPPQPLSVVICARNEAENLQKNLPSILQQNQEDANLHPALFTLHSSLFTHEILIVNDASTDTTASVLADFSKKYPILKTITLTEGSPRPFKGKKTAVVEGAKAAQHELVQLTDADCWPAGPAWTNTMQSQMAPHKDMVLGYGPYERRKGLLNKVIRYETLWTAIQYFSFSLWGVTYMGVGRNLLCRKSVLLKGEGIFAQNPALMSGDDDLLVNQTAKAGNVAICLDERAFVYSTPKTTWRAWWGQKRRHLSTGTHYKPLHQALLGLCSATHFLSVTALFFVIIGQINVTLLPFLLAARFILVWTVTGVAAWRLKERDLIWAIPLFDTAYFFYYLAFAPSLFLGKNQQWKN